MGREWPVNRARAWLLRKAAEMVERGDDSCVSEFSWQATTQREWLDEIRFRVVVASELQWSDAEVDRAVAEVYGEAPAATEATPLRPAEEVAESLICRIVTDEDGWAIGLPRAIPSSKFSADGAVASLAAIITQARAEGAAQERAARERAEKVAEAWKALLLAERAADTADGPDEYISLVNRHKAAAEKLRDLGIDPIAGAAVDQAGLRSEAAPAGPTREEAGR